MYFDAYLLVIVFGPCGVATCRWQGGIYNHVHPFTFNNGDVCIHLSMVGHTVVTCHRGLSASMSTSKRCCIVNGDVLVFCYYFMGESMCFNVFFR